MTGDLESSSADILIITLGLGFPFAVGPHLPLDTHC